MAYASWAARRSWLGRSSASWSDEAVERVVFEGLESRRAALSLAERRERLERAGELPRTSSSASCFAQLLQHAVAAELCDILTRRPDFWEPDEPARLALVACRWARRIPPARLG